MAQQLNVGVIGCGAISGAYLGMAQKFPNVVMAACADLDMDRAKRAADAHGIRQVLSVDHLLASKDVDIVLNLTVPKAHLPIAVKALQAGKHMYAEKPLGINRAEGLAMMQLAEEKRLRVGCAPDTFMGAGIQTARKLIDDGAIGKPIAFTAFMMCRGHEHWHPSPEFYYEKGGGPMFDMGPYYLTALLNLLGPVKRIAGMTSIAQPDRTISSKPKFGTRIAVETPDHVTGLMEFKNGCTGTIVQSFATRAASYDNANPITIYGTAGTVRVPDPNGFDGTVHLCTFGEKDEFVVVPPATATDYGRIVGLADMVEGILTGRPHRASGEQAMAVLDLMQGFQDASDTGADYRPVTQYTRPAPMPAGAAFGHLT